MRIIKKGILVAVFVWVWVLGEKKKNKFNFFLKTNRWVNARCRLATYLLRAPWLGRVVPQRNQGFEMHGPGGRLPPASHVRRGQCHSSGPSRRLCCVICPVSEGAVVLGKRSHVRSFTTPMSLIWLDCYIIFYQLVAIINLRNFRLVELLIFKPQLLSNSSCMRGLLVKI